MVTDTNRIQCSTDEQGSISLEHSNNTVIRREPYILQANFDHCFPNNSKVIHHQFEKKNAIIALSVAGCVLLLTTAIATVIYSSKDIIQVWMFNRYGFRFNKQDERNDGKMFDAFVSYSQKDQTFVTKSLVPMLEQKKPHYHLCLLYRDWPVGGSIAQTICESVEKSRRTIILLSENFMRSEWCQYEFQAAHYRVLHDKTIRLILILLDDKPPKNMDPELKLYIKTNTDLEWKDTWFWEKLRFALPDVDREARPTGRAYFQYLAGRPVVDADQLSVSTASSEDDDVNFREANEDGQWDHSGEDEDTAC